jgi:hypothetical protein
MSANLSGGEPTNDKELAQVKATTGYSAAADQARKSKMSPAELAWEKILEANLGDFYLPRYKKDIPVGALEYRKGAVTRLNEAATSLMKKHAIPVIDMNREITPVLNKYQLPKNCHYNDEGYEFMGSIVAGAIRKQLFAN